MCGRVERVCVGILYVYVCAVCGGVGVVVLYGYIRVWLCGYVCACVGTWVCQVVCGCKCVGV